MLIQRDYGVPPNFPLPPQSKMRLRRNLFVSTNGNDKNRGDFREPWVSVAYAMSQAFPGDTVFMRNGDYTGPNDCLDTQRFTVNAGTDYGDGAIILAGYPGETIRWIPPAGIFPVRLTYPNTVSYLILKNFEIDGVNQPDSLTGAPELVYTSSGTHHIRFQNLKLGNCMTNCIQFSTANVGKYNAALEVIDCIIHKAGQATGDSGHGGPGVNTGYGTYDTVDGTLYLRNRWIDNCAYAMNIYGSDHNVVANWILRNGTRGGSTAGLNFGSKAYSDTLPGQLTRNNRAWNNVIAFNSGNGLQLYTESEGTQAWNNTIYKNGFSGVFAQYLLSAQVGNNIVFANAVDFNDYTQGLVEYITNLQTDPLFVDAENDDFHLKSISPAIDAGTTAEFVERDYDGYKRPQGDAYCIGAFEFRGDNPDPIDPIPPVDGDCCCCCSCKGKKSRR